MLKLDSFRSKHDWHPRSSLFETPLKPDVKELCREGDALRRRLEGKRILENVK